MTSTEKGQLEGLRIIDVSPVSAMGEIDRCILVVWRLQPTAAAFELRHRELLELAARHPGQCAYVELIESTSKPPPDQLRKNAVEVFRKIGKDLCCVSFVMDGPELRSAFVRAILTTMTFFVPQMQPSKVFKRLSDMSQWVRARLPNAEPGFESRILAAFEFLRAQKAAASAATTTP